MHVYAHVKGAVINYTSKTQFLFRIEKGVPDVNDPGVNAHVDDSEYRVPFRNLVYIGDSDTDIPCMKLVNVNGGHSIGVYNPEDVETGKNLEERSEVDGNATKKTFTLEWS